jgi:hypothetical protein
VPGLDDEKRSGRKVINDETVERRIRDQLANALDAVVKCLEARSVRQPRS